MSPDEITRRLEMLERTVLEMGAELYQLRQVGAKAREYRDQFLTIMGGLKELLDEKGLISIDDFDTALHMIRMVDRSLPAADEAKALEAEKKSSH